MKQQLGDPLYLVEMLTTTFFSGGPILPDFLRTSDMTGPAGNFNLSLACRPILQLS
jgi:hypothetical protein